MGEPGAGKSTELLYLAQYLVVQTEQDEACPLPVILQLSSWAVKQGALADWMTEQIAVDYDIPRKVSQQWVENGQILPLLDGLDEMNEAARPACIVAINTYHRAHLTPLVVCSRTGEYEGAAKRERLVLQNAVVVRPLKVEQVEETLNRAGGAVAGLQVALHQQPALQDLATTPLMLGVLMLTYQGTSVQALSTHHEQVEQRIWADYLTCMVQRKGDVRRYPLELTRFWLGWLAHQMREHSQTIFYLEHMQPDWLTTRQRRIYDWFGVHLPGLLIGALVSIVMEEGFFLGDSFSKDPWGILLQQAILGGVLGGLLCPMMSRDTARMTGKVRGQWARALCISVGVGLVIGWISGWGFDFTHKDWLLDGFLYGVLLSLISLLLQSLLLASSRGSLPTLHSNSGRWAAVKGFIEQRYLQHALLIALLVGSRFGLSFGLACMVISMIFEHLRDGIHLTERVSFSWQNLKSRLFARVHLRLALVLTGCITVCVGLSFVLAFMFGASSLISVSVVQAPMMIFFLLISVLSVGLSTGLTVGLLGWLQYPPTGQCLYHVGRALLLSRDAALAVPSNGPMPLPQRAATTRNSRC